MRTYAYEIGRISADPNGAAATGPMPLAGPRIGAQRVVRQMRRQMRGHPDRADPRSAAAMRNAESLVQVQVAHIRANRTGAGQAKLRVHVGAIHI